MKIARETSEGLTDRSTAELEENISNIEEINRKVRANLDKDKAEEDAKGYREQYKRLTAQIEEIRSQKTDLLKEVTCPFQAWAWKTGGTGLTTDRNGQYVRLRTAEGIHCHCAQAEPGMWVCAAG